MPIEAINHNEFTQYLLGFIKEGFTMEESVKLTFSLWTNKSTIKVTE